MKFLDPQKEPNKWLQATLLDLLEQDTEESRANLIEGIKTVIPLLDPVMIDHAFAPWIEPYLELLKEAENNQSNVVR